MGLTRAQHTWAGRYEFLLHAEGREGGSGNQYCSGRCRWYFCSTTVATFSAEELAVYIPLHFLEDQRSATNFTASGLLDAFRKELPRLSQLRKLADTLYVFALAGFSS
jgi:hypothetical protein